MWQLELGLGKIFHDGFRNKCSNEPGLGQKPAGGGERSLRVTVEGQRRDLLYGTWCYTVRGEWHIINRICLACMILYTKLKFFLSIDQPGSAGL